MEKLDKAYQAAELFASIGLRLSREQVQAISQMEKQYIQEEVVPNIINDMASLVEKMQNKFQIEVVYKKEQGLNLKLLRKEYVERTIFDVQSEKTGRKKKYTLKVTFPNGQVSCHKHVWKTLVDGILYAGVDKVRFLNIPIMGGTLVSDRLLDDPRYRVAQKEIEPGIYVCTISSTDTKYNQIKGINSALGLGLNVEKVKL